MFGKNATDLISSLSKLHVRFIVGVKCSGFILKKEKKRKKSSV